MSLLQVFRHNTWNVEKKTGLFSKALPELDCGFGIKGKECKGERKANINLRLPLSSQHLERKRDQL